jgi:hypothetical protein
MNFYQLYNLINENTVSQEIKKFKQNKWFKQKDTIRVLLETVKKIIFPQNTLVNINENNKNIIATWVLFHYFKNKDLGASYLNWIDSVQGKNDIRSVQSSLSGFESDLTNKLRRGQFSIRYNLYAEALHDYIAANLDENGNLAPFLASKFNNPGFTGEDLYELSRQYHEDLRKGKIRTPGGEGKTLIEFPDGYKWLNLERGYCQKEGEAGKHCGNVNTRPGDTILSLRDRKNFIHLTFVLNNGVLEERKGYANSKPSSDLHLYIIELLKLPIIESLGRGRYLPENDFHLSDLKQEEAEEIIKLKPKMKNKYYRDLISLGREVPKDILFELINNHATVRDELVNNKNTDGEVLDKIARLYFVDWSRELSNTPKSYLVNNSRNLHKILPFGEEILKLINHPNIIAKSLKIFSSLDLVGDEYLVDMAKNRLKELI